MKRKITIYGLFLIIYAVLTVFLTSSIMSGLNLMLRFFINLFSLSLVLFIANLFINYRYSMTKVSCIGNALLLAVIACIIALLIDGIQGNSDAGSAIINEKMVNEVSDETAADGTRDVQMDVSFSEQDTSSRVVQIILDTLIAYLGGICGIRIYKKKNDRPGNVAMAE